MNTPSTFPDASGVDLYLLVDGHPKGPFSRIDVARKITSGLRPNTPCASLGGHGWTPVSEVISMSELAEAASGHLEKPCFRKAQPITEGTSPSAQQFGLSLSIFLLVGLFTICIMVSVYWGIALAMTVSLGAFCWKLAKEKGYSPLAWFWLGVCFGPLALLAAVGLPRKY